MRWRRLGRKWSADGRFVVSAGLAAADETTPRPVTDRLDLLALR